ncbi:MAG: succinyl-diaminopimelate desuccinylase, partial [Pseudohongiellaceae bacterium]
MTDTLALARSLIERASVTPEDGGCQDIIGARLETLGFRVERMPFGAVSNLWAEIGTHGPLLVFAGHTDVVPAGDPAEWDSDPFQASERDGYLYGRGAADMKSSLAAMVTAAERFCARGQPAGRLGFLITSDEEGVAVDGTVRVMQTLLERAVQIDYCVVGEPSSSATLGDTIKVGRRGSLSGRLRFLGSKGHVAYPQLADNAVHGGLSALNELIVLEWDRGNAYFPPTSLQISNVRAGVGAGNVIPGRMEVDFNLRFSTETDAATIRQRVGELLDRHGYRYEIDWQLSGEPFLTRAPELIAAATESIADITGVTTESSTAGGTSDGRFIAPTGAQVVELGPVNATIHKVNERVRIADLEPLSQI